MSRPMLAALTATLLIVTVHTQGPTPAGEWRYYGGDAASTKYSPLAQITPANVKNLQVAWRWSSPDNEIVKTNPTARPGGFQDTPIMANGVLYTTTSLGVYAALDPVSGRTLWQYDPEIWKAGRPPNLGYTHRGIAYWTDGTKRRLIGGTHDAHLVSIDAETGKPDPTFGNNGYVDVIDGLPYAERVKNYAINSTPVIVKNVIIAGSNIHDGPLVKEQPRGDIFGFDVAHRQEAVDLPRRCRRQASSDTTPGTTAPPTTPATTNVWSMLTVDDQLGYVYLPFGTPTDDYYGGHRPGNNLFAESLVCLDATTGKRVWHFQAVHHGLWDYDFPGGADSRRHHRQRPPHQRRRAGEQAGIPLCLRSQDRHSRSGRSRNAPCRSRSAPGERTSPTQPFPTRPPAFERQGMTDDDVIDFTPELQGAGARDSEEVRSRTALHAAVRARHRSDARQRRRSGLGRRRARSADRHALRAVGDESDHRSVDQGRSGARQPAVPARRHAGRADARWPADLQAALQPRHGLRPEHRHDCVAGAARRWAARPSASQGSQARSAWRRRARRRRS